MAVTELPKGLVALRAAIEGPKNIDVDIMGVVTGFLPAVKTRGTGELQRQNAARNPLSMADERRRLPMYIRAQRRVILDLVRGAECEVFSQEH
jgi:hypothetical protein